MHVEPNQCTSGCWPTSMIMRKQVAFQMPRCIVQSQTTINYCEKACFHEPWSCRAWRPEPSYTYHAQARVHSTGSELGRSAQAHYAKSTPIDTRHRLNVCIRACVPAATTAQPVSEQSATLVQPPTGRRPHTFRCAGRNCIMGCATPCGRGN
jgi:hypothetical protein